MDIVHNVRKTDGNGGDIYKIAVMLPAGHRTVTIQTDQNNLYRATPYRATRYRLSFPSSLFVMVARRPAGVGPTAPLTFYSLRVGSLTSPDDIVHHFPLPNIDGCGGVCMGFSENPTGETQEEMLEKMIDLFWNSSFTTALRYNFHFYRDTVLADYAAWQTASRNLNWVPDNFSPISLGRDGVATREAFINF